MAADNIELDCPGCKTRLTIDSGFGGGVCRCSSCGTLMTVPKDPSREHAEKLMRPMSPSAMGTQEPQRPSAPASRPASPQAASGATQSPASASKTSRPSAPGRPSKPASTPAAASPSAPVEEGLYVTESGKQVHITSATRIPVAIKRKALKISIVVVFVLVMGGMVGLVVAGMVYMNQSGSLPAVTQSQIDADIKEARGNYEPEVNPFLLEKPNVLGLEVTRSVVVVVDTARASRSWLSMAADGIIQGMLSDHEENSDLALQVILVGDEGAKAVPETLATLTAESRKRINDTLLGVRPRGRTTLASALAIAIAQEPTQIILLTSQSIDGEMDDALGEQTSNSKLLKFDIIYFGDAPQPLQNLASSHGGQIVSLPILTLSDWYQKWLDHKESQKDTN